jgi:hypothetical protein
MITAAVIVELKVRSVDSDALTVVQHELLLIHPDVRSAHALQVFDVYPDLRILSGAGANRGGPAAVLWAPSG